MIENEKEEFDKWLKRISKAEKNYADYHDLVKEIREYYKNERKRNKSNLFWSSIETLKPFLYFKAPKVYVERKSKNANDVERVAASILEKTLEWDLEQFDFDSAIKYARNDYLLSGCGILLEKYTPAFKKVMLDNTGKTVDLLDSEKIETVYIDPVDFIADSEKVGIWENCTWVARVVNMTKQEVVAQFGEELQAYIDADKDDENKNTRVYEIWDKIGKKVLYICQDFNDRILKTKEMPDLVSGYPMPKPIYCTLTNDSLIPVPDYVEIKTLLDELDGVNSRMRLTMQALKVTGCYDNSFPELANILDKDVSLLSVSDFTKLKEKGGLSGIVDFMPIGQYIEALQGLSERRAQLTQTIYEITGVSDIMRGSSDPKETATAVQKKTNFGTLRNQDRQNDMQRFITDLLKIKAEMICEMFREETLIRFADSDVDDKTKKQAIMLLRENKTRDLCIGIETETGFQQDNTQEKTLEAVKIINELVARSFEFVSAQPSLLPLYKQLTQSVVSTLPNTRQFEPVIDEVFNKIGIELAQPDQPDEQNQEDILKAQNEMAKTKLQAQKNANDLAIKQEQNAIKRNEIMLKNQVDNRKLDYTKEEMDRQFTLKEMDLAIDGNTDANITTGLVGAP
ncbi:MAG: hypothetical protein VZR95_06045 [Alphaproteobacteria bacterium]